MNMNEHSKFTNVFSEENLFWGRQTILGLKMVYPHNFGSALRILGNFYTMKGAKRYI